LAGEEPEVVGDAVDVVAEEWADDAAMRWEGNEAAFGAAGGGAGEVEGGGVEVGPGRGPAGETDFLRFDGGDAGVHAGEVGVCEFGEFGVGVTGGVGLVAGDLAHEIHEIFLDAFEFGAGVGGRAGGFGEGRWCRRHRCGLRWKTWG
jgi:hypothetical protein